MHCALTKVSYLCPKLSGCYSKALIKIAKCIDPESRLGIVNSNSEIPFESREFHSTQNGKCIVNGERKLHDSSLDCSELGQIIDGFDNLYKSGKRAHIHIVVARSIVNFKKLHPKDYSIYHAKYVRYDAFNHVNQYAIERSYCRRKMCINPGR